MSRYIDADKLVEQMLERYKALTDEYGDYDHYTTGYDDAIDEVESFPAADVVEVVRCKDCKHWVKGGYDPIISRKFGSCTCEYWEHPTEYFETVDTDYCSYGERKDGNGI